MGVGWRGGPLVLPVRVSCSWKGETGDGGKTALACPTEGRARALPGRHAAAARGVPTAAATPRPGGAGPDGNPTAARGYAVEGGARLPPSRAARCTPPPRGRPPRTGRWHRPTASLQASQGHRPSSGVTRCEQRTRPASPGQRRRPLRLSRQAVPPAEARVSLHTRCRRPAPAATLCGALASRGFALHFWSLMRRNVFLTFTAILMASF